MLARANSTSTNGGNAKFSGGIHDSDEARTHPGRRGRRRCGRPAWRLRLQSSRHRRHGQGSGQGDAAAEGRLLQRRPAGDLVRAGQAGGRVLGQPVQRRGHLVRRPARRCQAALGDRQHGLAEVGFRGHPGFRHRHAHRAGQQDDRRRHPGHRHGYADRPARYDQGAELPRARQRIHGRLGHPGAGQRHQRRRHDRHDPGRARPHRRAGARARLQVGGLEIPQGAGARRAAGRLGRDQGRPHLGDAADQISEDRRGVLPQ